MKKLLLAILTGLVITSCDPNEELYNKLDQDVEPYNENIEYTLTGDDYSAIFSEVSDQLLEEATNEADSNYAYSVSDRTSFSEEFSAKELIRSVLSLNFPALNKNSSANVTYNYTPAYLSKFSSFSIDTLVNEDYDSLGIDFFSSADAPDALIPGLLDKKFSLAQPGALKKVCYDYQSDYGNIDTQSSFYFKAENGWETIPEVYEMTSADYTSIEGVEEDYFLSNAQANEIMPVFLENRFPYAKEGDTKIVVYDYGSSQRTKAEQYMLDSTGWYAKVIRNTQFVHNGEKWAFDPTVRFTLKSADYEMIVDYVAGDPQLQQYVDSVYENSEYYYGASYYYNNFDVRVFKRVDYEPETFEGLSSQAATNLIFERIVKEALIIVLENKFPDAVPQVDGIDVFYEITFDAYDGNDDVYTVRYQCTAAGDPPTFEYISGDTPYEEE